MSYPTVRSRLDKIIDSLRQVILETSDEADEVFGERERTEAAARLIKAI